MRAAPEEHLHWVDPRKLLASDDESVRATYYKARGELQSAVTEWILGRAGERSPGRLHVLVAAADRLATHRKFSRCPDQPTAGRRKGRRRSLACSSCRHVLGAFDLLPLLSWLALNRRCRYCGSPIGWFYPGIEMAAMVVPIWAATEVGSWLLWASCALGWVLLTLAVIDARHLLLPDVLTLPLLAGGLAVAATSRAPR